MNRLLFSMLVLILLITATVTAANTQGKSQSHIFQIDETTDLEALEALVDVRHETDTWISGEVDEEDLEAAQILAVSSEEVFEYEITRYGEVEDLIEPGRASGSKKPGERLCTPDEQIGYNVEQMNGGSIQDGAGVKVAVLDTGIDTDHVDLDVFVCKDATQGGIIQGCEDELGHGTQTSSVVAANGGNDREGMYGVAPRTQLWMIKVCDSRGWCRTDDIARAIDYAADNGADIISMSFGGPYKSQYITDAILRNPDVLYVAAAGNRMGYDTLLYPAALPEVIAVGAIDENKEHVFFSSQGRNDGDGIIEEGEIELVSGGVKVPLAHYNGCYVKGSATSYSTPGISGIAAAVWHEGGNTAEKVREYLQQIAEDLLPSGVDEFTGFGLPIAP